MLPRLLTLALLVLPTSPAWANCPFCTAVSQTLRVEIKQMDVAVLATYVAADSDSISKFKIEHIYKGESFAKVGDIISTSYFGKGNPEQKFFLMGIDPPHTVWSSPLKVNENVQSYLEQLQKLPADDSAARLKFFLSHLGDNDPIIARDVFDEFASASYSEMIALKDQYNREQLLEWIQNFNLSPDRRKLYLVMLGICGQKQDADVLEKMLLSKDANQQAGLDALIACYLTLKGEAGLKIVNENFLGSQDSSYHDIYAAVMALRFHGTDAGVIDKKAITQSLRLLLDRPKLADLVIPDLARWEDWSQIDKIVALFKASDDNETSWLRIPAIRYLQACPLPEAAKALEELKELDPATYKRAMQFFPQPAATDNSSFDSGTPIGPTTEVNDLRSIPRRLAGPLASVASSRDTSEHFPLAKSQPTAVNSYRLVSVIATICSTLWVGMWLVITGAGRQPAWLLWLLRARS
jgi:hypothetical protein